jgi:hypothetical protein
MIAGYQSGQSVCSQCPGPFCKYLTANLRARFGVHSRGEANRACLWRMLSFVAERNLHNRRPRDLLLVSKSRHRSNRCFPCASLSKELVLHKSRPLRQIHPAPPVPSPVKKSIRHLDRSVLPSQMTQCQPKRSILVGIEKQVLTDVIPVDATSSHYPPSASCGNSSDYAVQPRFVHPPVFHWL